MVPEDEGQETPATGKISRFINFTSISHSETPPCRMPINLMGRILFPSEPPWQRRRKMKTILWVSGDSSEFWLHRGGIHVVGGRKKMNPPAFCPKGQMASRRHTLYLPSPDNSARAAWSNHAN
jgi:hypothetical protein